eukprot:6196027-Pleurochrysis_carterae.AAC.1
MNKVSQAMFHILCRGETASGAVPAHEHPQRAERNSRQTGGGEPRGGGGGGARAGGSAAS